MNVPIITYSNIYSGVCPASNNSWCFLNFELKSQTPHNTHLRQFPKCMCCPGKAADRPPLRCEQCNSYSHQNTASTGDESDQYYDSCPSQLQTQVVFPVHRKPTRHMNSNIPQKSTPVPKAESPFDVDPNTFMTVFFTSWSLWLCVFHCS